MMQFRKRKKPALQTRAQIELQSGQGNIQYPYPVDMEPPFTPYSAPHAYDHVHAPAAPGCPPLLPPYKPFTIKLAEKDDNSLQRQQQRITSMDADYPVDVTFIVMDGGITIQIAAAEPDIKGVMAQTEIIFPTAELTPGNDLIEQVAPKLKVCRAYGLAKSHLRCLKTQFQSTPYLGLGVATRMKFAIVQMLLQRPKHNWADNLAKVVSHPYDPKRPAFVSATNVLKSLDAKTASPLVLLSLRIGACSPSELGRIERLILPQFSDENYLVPISNSYPIDALLTRRSYSHGMILSAQEATLCHVLDPDSMPSVLKYATPSAPPPQIAGDILIPIGVNYYRSRETQVGLTEAAFTRHLVIFGRSGMGKSTLATHMMAALMRCEP